MGLACLLSPATRLKARPFGGTNMDSAVFFSSLSCSWAGRIVHPLVGEVRHFLSPARPFGTPSAVETAPHAAVPDVASRSLQAAAPFRLIMLTPQLLVFARLSRCRHGPRKPDPKHQSEVGARHLPNLLGARRGGQTATVNQRWMTIRIGLQDGCGSHRRGTLLMCMFLSSEDADD